MMNLTMNRDCRIFTSRSELDQKVRFPVRMFSPVTGATMIVNDRAALASFLRDHIDAIPRCFYTVGELLEWLTEPEPTNRVRQSKHADAVRGIPYAETMIYMG